MSPQDILSLFRRHLVATLAVILVAAGFAYYLKHHTAAYDDSAVAEFNTPASTLLPNPFTSPSSAMINFAGVLAILEMSPQGQDLVHQAGGYGDYNVALVNSYNLEYPDYSTPALTVFASSTDPAVASATFAAVLKVLQNDLNSLQEHAHVAPADLVTMNIIGTTGPIYQQGSSKRVYGGLLFLTIIALFAVVGYVDRHGRRRLRWLAARARFRRFSGAQSS